MEAVTRPAIASLEKRRVDATRRRLAKEVARPSIDRVGYATAPRLAPRRLVRPGRRTRLGGRLRGPEAAMAEGRPQADTSVRRPSLFRLLGVAGRDKMAAAPVDGSF